MSFLQRMVSLAVYFSVATLLAQAGLLAVVWQRGSLNQQTAQHLLAIAYDIPVRDLYERLIADTMPNKKEMVSFSEVQEARMLASLDLDLRDLSANKGSEDLSELAVLLDEEKGRYTVVKEQFDRDWADLQKGATDSALRDLRRQIESLHAKAAKDQLLRILDSADIPPDKAMKQVVTIFKNLSLEKRKKIVAEFKNNDAQRLQELLRQIRLGTPEIEVLRDARAKLQEFRVPD